MKNKDPKLEELQKHADRWRDRFEKIQDETLAQFSGQPLDKKTAIVCTGFLMTAINELTEAVVDIASKVYPEADESFKYLHSDPQSPLKYSDAPRPWVAEILAEVCGGYPDNDALMTAYCNAINTQNAVELCWKRPDVVERECERIKETPL